MVNSRMFFTNFTFEFPKSALTDVWAAEKSLGRAEICSWWRGMKPSQSRQKWILLTQII